MTEFNLKNYGINVARIMRNPFSPVLYEEALQNEKGTAITNLGTMIALSGEKTGRSPKDKRIVRESGTKDDIWWGDINMPIEDSTFQINRQRALDYLNTRDRLFVIDGFAGWDKKYRIKVRVICERAYHALFMRNMLIRPTDEELAEYGEPEYVIYNAGRFQADPNTPGLGTSTSVNLSFERKEMVILGTEYAGEMKKGVFTIMNYLMPKRGILSMHCSANKGDDGNVAVFFGLSGTGKTTLSADPKRALIGDDEHCWTDNGVFNIEGGCYAKMIDLNPKEEPEIYNALRFGTVMENMVYDKASRQVDFHDTSITQNTRGSYPIEYIENACIPCTGPLPNNVIFLTADAFSVLPPVSKLTPEQAMYHFISGYTAKVAGTEVGVVDPEATFSPCFGGPFLVWHPTKYAELLAKKMRETGATAWLVNTGWSGGPFGIGKRMSLKYTRAIIDAIHSGELEKVETIADPTFGFAIPTSCPNVPSEILTPKNTWADKAAYDETAKKLARLYVENFRAYADQASEELLAAGPITE